MRSFRTQPASPQFTSRYSAPASTQRNNRASSLAIIAFFISAFLYMSHSPAHHKGAPPAAIPSSSEQGEQHHIGESGDSNTQALKVSRPLLDSSAVRAAAPRSGVDSTSARASKNEVLQEKGGEGSAGQVEEAAEDEVAVQDGRESSTAESESKEKGTEEEEPSEQASKVEDGTKGEDTMDEDQGSKDLKGALKPVLHPGSEDEGGRDSTGSEHPQKHPEEAQKQQVDDTAPEKHQEEGEDAKQEDARGGKSSTEVSKHDVEEDDDVQVAAAAAAAANGDERLEENTSGGRRGSTSLTGKPERPVIKGQYERIEERAIVWQIPERPPKGTVFFAHGCRHKATHFWPKSASCAECIGLPEEVELVREALGRGYAAIAIASAKGCWDLSPSIESSEDLGVVVKILKSWRQKHELSRLPLMAVGASSGGSFVTVLATAMKLGALTVMISPGARKAMVKEEEAIRAFPPTLFVHMPKDSATAGRVETSVRLLKEEDVESAELECQERKVLNDYFSNTVGVSQKLSKEIVSALEDAGLLSSSGFLKRGYRAKWESALEAKNLLGKMDEATKAAVKEELNVAYAWHEISSEHVQEIMDWFDGVCRTEGKLVKGRCTS